MHGVQNISQGELIDRNYQSFIDTIDKLTKTEWYVLLQQKDFKDTSNDTLFSVPLVCRAFLASISKKQNELLAKFWDKHKCRILPWWVLMCNFGGDDFGRLLLFLLEISDRLWKNLPPSRAPDFPDYPPLLGTSAGQPTNVLNMLKFTFQNLMTVFSRRSVSVNQD